jgi:hypothetical protein
MFGIVYNDTSYIFGPNYKIKILEFELDDAIYVSRSHYRSKLTKYEDQIYHGKDIKIPEKESELIETLLLNPINNPDKKIITVEMTNISNALCSRCSGKGFMDWVEESLNLELKPCCQKELDFTYNKMLLSYVVFYSEYYTLFYRQRNMNNDYIRDCKICSKCMGIGFDYEFLKYHIPEQYALFLELVILQYIKSEQKIFKNK